MTKNPDQAIVDALDDVWGSLQRLGADLDETQWKLPTDCPGWTVQDNLAHIIGIESVILGLPEPAVALPDLPHVRNELGARTRSGWNRSDRCRGHDVLERFRAVAEQRLDILRSQTEASGRHLSWTPTGPGTVRDLIPFRVLDSFIPRARHAPRPRAAGRHAVAVGAAHARSVARASSE